MKRSVTIDFNSSSPAFSMAIGATHPTVGKMITTGLPESYKTTLKFWIQALHCLNLLDVTTNSIIQNINDQLSELIPKSARRVRIGCDNKNPDEALASMSCAMRVYVQTFRDSCALGLSRVMKVSQPTAARLISMDAESCGSASILNFSKVCVLIGVDKEIINICKQESIKKPINKKIESNSQCDLSLAI